jgi:hypothetical protein
MFMLASLRFAFDTLQVSVSIHEKMYAAIVLNPRHVSRPAQPVGRFFVVGHAACALF